MVVLTPADQERIRSFVNRWHEELRNAADEMNLDPSELAVFVGKMFVSIPKASRPRRAIDVYKREVYATHKGTGKDALDKGILAEISNGWKVIKEDKARLEEYEERARDTVRDVNRDVNVRGSSLLKDANKIIKVMNNLADSLSQTTGSEALIVITNRLPGLHPMADLQGSNRAVIAEPRNHGHIAPLGKRGYSRGDSQIYGDAGQCCDIHGSGYVCLSEMNMAILYNFLFYCMSF